MKRSINKLAIVVAVAGISMASCNKQLDIPSRNSLDAALALTNKAGVEASLNSVYAVLKSERLYGRDMFSVAEALADVAYANGRSNRLISENRNANGAHMANWATAYGAINEINLTLAAIPNLNDATTAEKDRWEGEFKFLRALYHFDLLKNYAYIPTYVVPSQDRGGIVINLKGFNSATAATSYFPARATIAEGYAQVLSDLYKAISNLSTTNRGRNYASKHAALALGSRIYLYMGNWAKADSFATAAIGITGGLGAMTSTTNYVSGWRAADHPEGIFQLVFATVGENLGLNTSLAATHTTLATPGALNGTRSGQGDLVPNIKLLTELGISGFPSTLSAGATPPALTYSNDVRNKLFEWGVNAGGRYVECTKWMGKNGSANWDNTVILRWPELYLNRAEAKYQQHDEDGAWADLNVIRAARYTGFVAPGTRDLSGQALLNEILRQRMLEYAFEGYRFYDLARYGLGVVKDPYPAGINLPSTDYRMLARIPQSEVDGNPNMKQNFNY